VDEYLANFQSGTPQANSANIRDPFIAKPAGSSAVSGIVYHECLVAVGGNLSLIPQFFDGFDTMQNSFTRRPQFNFIDQAKQLDALAIVSFGWFFYFFLWRHG
jgi:hypothetical protein